MKEGLTNFDQFFNLSKDMICYIRPDGFFDRMNPAWSLQFGWTQEELRSKNILEFLHPDDQPRFSEPLIRAMEGRAAVTFENRFRCKDSTYKWISWNAYFLPEQNRVFALTYDISPSKQASEMLRVIREDLETRLQQLNIELKRVQRQLSLSEMRFDLLEQNVEQYAVMVLDVEGHIVKWSAGAERMLGYHAKEIIGEYFSRFYQAEDIWRGRHHHALRSVLANGRFEDNGLRLRKDGTSFYAHVILMPFFDEAGTLSGFMKIMCDRTEYKKLHDQLRTAEERNHKLFEESMTGYCVLSPDGSINTCNHSFATMVGFESIHNAQQSNMNNLFPNSAVPQAILRSLYEHEIVQGKEFQLQRTNGELVSVLANFFGQFNDNGELVEVHGSFLNISKQKEAERHWNQKQNIGCND
ncbi:MAG TPA: PAS domain-containing protein [Bacteroidota bacterium]|nr:PAS domain-containing protein [Bacteroidota bacterium]